MIYANCGKRWEVALMISDMDGFQQTSFVNCINTSKGGTHVNYVMDQIVEHLLKEIRRDSSTKNLTISKAHIKSQVHLFLNCQIEKVFVKYLTRK